MRFDKANLIIIAVAVFGVGDAALAWSTIPTTSSSSSSSSFPVRRRRQYPAYNLNPAHGTAATIESLLLRSQIFDDANNDGTDDTNENEENDGIIVEQQRRRKRDILRRTLLGLSTSSSTGDVKKLNTEKFLSRQLFSSNNNNNNIHDDDDAPIVFRSPGQIQNPDLLTPEEVSNLNAKYEALKRITEERTLLEMLNESSDEGNRSSSSSSSSNKIGTTISPEEARRIVDYTVDEERLTELRALDEIKKRELMQQWEEEGISAENKIDAEMMMSTAMTTATSPNHDGEQNAVGMIKADAVERAVQNDGVVREILQEEERQLKMEDGVSQQRKELELYERTMMAQAVVTDDDDVNDKRGGNVREGKNGGEKDEEAAAASSFDNAYETAVARIQKSRKTKIGPRTLGVLANSLALEEGKEYIRKSKREKEFLMEVERELELYFRERRGGVVRGKGGIAGDDNDVVVGDEDMATFFRPPENLAEERMYRSIIRQIADKRESEDADEREQQDQRQIKEADDDLSSSNNNEEIVNDDSNMISKYKLSAKETVEAYKLLNLWREVQSLQDSMEVSLGMKDDDATRKNTRPTNKIEPFFLYEEDTEDKRRKEKESLTMALRKLLESEDNAEISSNELLMNELLEGRVTKDKLVRLLDKLSTKATDNAIKDSLVELKILILEGKEKVDGDEDGVFFSKRKNSKSSGQPLDLSGIFRTSDMGEEEEPKAPVLSSSSSPTKPLYGGRTMPSWVSEQSSLPNTSSSSSSTTNVFDEVRAPPPPNTPFFQALMREGGDDLPRERSPAGGMFGTYEEQRLQKLAKRVGAQTDEEMEELRRNMEALNEAEMLADARLNDANFELGGIDISALNLDDDNDDQIKSILGKRPVASSSTSSSLGPKKVVLEFNEKEETEGIFVDAEGRLRKMDSGGKEIDIAADIFRAKTAGRYTDEETREADETAFRDFLKLEEEVERSLELLDNEALSVDIDINAYADDIMSEMAPRPQLRPRREDFMSQEELLLERKKESIFGDDDSYPIERSRQGTSSSGGSMPEWFLKEQEALGIKVEDIDEDDFDEARREWEREERQRKADEYLKKRGGGISISDVLGREYFGPMDEPDYGRRLPTFDSFQARKELLLGYTELTVEDINNVVDYKVDPLSNGYNRYLARVQRPFSEYGAIFRLEGVLVDMIGMHARAWKTVTEAFDYNLQSSDDVKQASLYRPEDAVREVFYWTDDVLEVKDIAEAYRTAFAGAFNEWIASGCLIADASDEQSYDKKGVADGVDTETKAMPSGEEMHSMYYIAWSKLATKLGRPAPTFDEVYRGMLGGNWEDAVRDIFAWSNDQSEIHEILATYDEILEGDYKILLQKYGIDVDLIKAKEEKTLFGLDFPALSLQEGVRDCLDTLREVEMPCAVVSHLDANQLDLVLERTGLAEYFAPDNRVSADSNYSSERSELLGAALRVEQRPDQCIVFDNTPKSATVAHEICMKSLSFVNHYARYELLTADLAVGSARDIDLRSLVKLFDRRDDLEPLLELDVNSGLQRQQRKLRTAFWDE